MLNGAGFHAKLLTPEWATLWSNVQAGKTPFYYMGRGSIVDPSVALSQYFETGGSPRIGYSNPKFDKLLATERQTFEPAKRRKVLSEAMSLLTDDAPACFMWRHKMIYGVAKQIDYKPTPSGRIFGEDIRVLK
jgi:peptide/nickel transport system substrate-binding protein